jgi:hypothetical protein
MNTVPCISHNARTELENVQKDIKEFLLQAKEHCYDMNESNINVASITVDMKSLSDYLYKFSTNLNKVFENQGEEDGLSNAVFCEIQNFIQYKTKSLNTVLPYKESTIDHSDWWGRMFKTITQRIWIMTEKSTPIFRPSPTPHLLEEKPAIVYRN